MAISFQCSNCHQAYKVGDERGGQSVKCQKCGAAVSIPLAAKSAPAATCAMCLNPVSALDTACPHCGARLGAGSSAPSMLPAANWTSSPQTPSKKTKLNVKKESNRLAVFQQQWFINLVCLGSIFGMLAGLGLYGYRAYQRSAAEFDRKLALQYKNRNMQQWLEIARTGSTKYLSSPFEWREAATLVPVDPDALPELFKALDDKGEAGRFAQTALVRFDGEKCRSFKPQLVPLLSAPNPLVRAHALVLLGKLGRDAQDLVASFPEERDPLVRRQMIVTLGQVGGIAAVQKLKGLASDISDPLFGDALSALGSASGKEAVAIIDRVLKQKDNPQAQLAAIAALPHCGADGVPALCAVFREFKPGDANYNSGLQALGMIDASAANAADELAKLLESTDNAVRSQAGLALGAVVGQKPGVAVGTAQLAALVVDQSQILPLEIDARITRMNDAQMGDGAKERTRAEEGRIQRRVFAVQWAAEQLGKRREPSVRPQVQAALDTLRRQVEAMRKHSLMSAGNVQVGKLEGDHVTYQRSAAQTDTVIVDVDKFRAQERAAALEAQRNAFRTHFSQIEGLCNLLQQALQ